MSAYPASPLQNAGLLQSRQHRLVVLPFPQRGAIEIQEGLSFFRRNAMDAAGITHNPLALVEQRACEAACTVLAAEPRVKIFLFGSRATGRAGVRSDIDVGVDLGHAIAPAVLVALCEAFEQLPILQKVEVVDFFGVDETFKQVALQQTLSLYERQAA